MTMYFPLVVHGAMLIEPTETESKAGLDQFIAALRSIAERAKAGDESLKAAPIYAPRRRLDETLAARKPVLAYKTPAPDGAEGDGAADRDGRWRIRAAFTKARPKAPSARHPRRCAIASRSPQVLARLASGKRPGARNRQRHRRTCGLISRAAFPNLDWQPSDVDPSALASIAAWREDAGFPTFGRRSLLDAASR